MTIDLDGTRIRQLRKTRGWSQEHLAQLVSRSCRTIQRVERAGTCDLETRSALAVAFEVPAQALDRGLESQSARSNESEEAFPQAAPIPMSPASLFAYANGHPRPIALLNRVAARRGLATRPVDPESAYLNEQISALGIKTVRELDDMVARHCTVADRISDYLQPDRAIDTGFMLSLVVQVAVMEARGLEGFAAYQQRLRYSSGGDGWAKELFGYYTELKAYT